MRAGRAAVLFLVLLCYVATSAASPKKQEKVAVEFYMEALCPYCAQATTNVVAPLFQNGLSAYIDLTIIPFGNARNSSEGELTCQHGPAECRLNRVLACAIDQGRCQGAWFPFVACVEGSFGPGAEGAVEGCAEQAGLDFVDIQECATGAKGDALERAASDRTNGLVPKHTYVPWLVVEGVPLLDGYEHLQKFICVALPADARPDVCFGTGSVEAGATNGVPHEPSTGWMEGLLQSLTTMFHS